MQPHLLEELRTRIQTADLGKYEALLLPRARLAFDMRLDGQSSGTLGESRWGGVPDVPADFQWPHIGKFPLMFLGQINLADLIEDAENPFPTQGLLQFFADFESDECLITLLSPSLTLHPAQAPENVESLFGDMPAHHLTLEPRADLPQWATSDQKELTKDMTEDEQDAYNDAFNVTEGSKGESAGQLLGHVAGIGIDPREDAFIVREHPGTSPYDYAARENLDMSGITRWRNLAVFDSVQFLNFTIGDAGYFGFLIHEDDLKRLDFSRVYAHLQSS